MKKTAILFTIVLNFAMIPSAYAEDSPEPQHIEDSCPVVSPVIKTVYVNVPVPGPTVYVDKLIAGPTVYVNVPVPGPIANVPVPGPTVYVDKPVVETQTITVPGPITTVTIENPLNIALQSKFDALKIKYIKILRSYTLLHKHEVKEKAKYFSRNK